MKMWGELKKTPKKIIVLIVYKYVKHVKIAWEWLKVEKLANVKGTDSDFSDVLSVLPSISQLWWGWENLTIKNQTNHRYFLLLENFLVGEVS